MLDNYDVDVVRKYFTRHPVLGRYLDEVCVALTGSYAFGLGGSGADIDVKVLCSQGDYDRIRHELETSGRIKPDAATEEDLDGVVGDYALEPVDGIRCKIQGEDLTPAFIYGRLVYLMGKKDLMDTVTTLCRPLPEEVLNRGTAREGEAFFQAEYAFLRSFQTGDLVGRYLAKAGMARSAMRLAFLETAQAPPYDKHLFRLLPELEKGLEVQRVVQSFLSGAQGAEEEKRYAAVAKAPDWRAMYLAAAGTPAMVFREGVLGLLDREA